ncbi:hypothetical protein CJJ09_003022 [Candidozyma auris]|nr:hypothetical protein CJJ09_003022 [[Candida] auris]
MSTARPPWQKNQLHASSVNRFVNTSFVGVLKAVIHFGKPFAALMAAKLSWSTTKPFAALMAAIKFRSTMSPTSFVGVGGAIKLRSTLAQPFAALMAVCSVISEYKPDNRGLISADRNNKATLPLTIPVAHLSRMQGSIPPV